MIDNIVDQLKRDEGEVLHVYLDQLGIPTAGVGHNLSAHHQLIYKVGDLITQAQSDEWLQEDLQETNLELQHNLLWVWDLDVVRRGVFQNMNFNMSINRLMGFVNTLAAAKAGDWQRTHDEMLKSRWATEVGARAYRLAIQIVKGEWQ